MADPRSRSYRAERLEALKAVVGARAAHAAVDKASALKELVVLLNELDPIRRHKNWPSWIIREIARDQQGKCAHCGEMLPGLHEGAVHVHHLIPWSLGGGNEVRNLRILHEQCNLIVGRRCDDDDLIDYLRGRVLNL